MTRDSDGSPKGGDACGSVHDSAGRQALPKITAPPVTTPTPEELALARKCAAKYWQTGEASDEMAARRILSGEWDDQAYVQAALAAIRETTELAYALAANHADQSDDTAVGRARNGTARDIYEALRTNAHLKGEADADT